MHFCCEVRPSITSTFPFGTARYLARTAHTSSFALPLSGAALSLTLSLPFAVNSSTFPDWERGITFTSKIRLPRAGACGAFLLLQTTCRACNDPQDCRLASHMPSKDMISELNTLEEPGAPPLSPSDRKVGVRTTVQHIAETRFLYSKTLQTA